VNIVVCVKQVPDTAAKLEIDASGQVSWGDAGMVINPWDEYAVEAALQVASANGGKVTALSLGPESAQDALKHALAMGCKGATLVSDPALSAVDTQGAARALAAAIQQMDDVQLVFFGKQAVDGDGGVTAAQTARVLGWDMVSFAATLPEIDGGTLKADRAIEEGRQSVTAALPAVVSVVKDVGEPRYPSFMGIRKASRAKIPVLSLGDLGIEAPTKVVDWPELMNLPTEDVSVEMITGDSPADIANKLADKILAEKVL
jgi:electron transfer flavoprotein beta subunit